MATTLPLAATATTELYGGFGVDTMDGGAGDDLIYAGGGADSLTGGAGADDFIYFTATEVGNGVLSDVITDFLSGVDDLNFSLIQAGMTFIGVDAAFTGAAGEIRFLSGLNQVQAQVDGIGAIDFTLTLTGVASVTAADFIL